MVRSIWRGALVLLLAGFGLAWSQPSRTSSTEKKPQATMTVHENGKDLLCRVIQSWKTAGGARAFQLQVLATEEKLTLVEDGPATTFQGKAGKMRALSMRIYHWGRQTTSPPGAPLPPKEEPKAVPVAKELDSGPVLGKPDPPLTSRPSPSVDRHVSASVPKKDNLNRNISQMEPAAPQGKKVEPRIRPEPLADPTIPAPGDVPCQVSACTLRPLSRRLFPWGRRSNMPAGVLAPSSQLISVQETAKPIILKESTPVLVNSKPPVLPAKENESAPVLVAAAPAPVFPCPPELPNQSIAGSQPRGLMDRMRNFFQKRPDNIATKQLETSIPDAEERKILVGIRPTPAKSPLADPSLHASRPPIIAQKDPAGPNGNQGDPQIRPEPPPLSASPPKVITQGHPLPEPKKVETGPSLADILKKLDQLEKTIENIKPLPGPPGPPGPEGKQGLSGKDAKTPDLSPLAAQLAKIQAQVDYLANNKASSRAALKAVQDHIDALKNRKFMPEPSVAQPASPHQIITRDLSQGGSVEKQKEPPIRQGPALPGDPIQGISGPPPLLKEGTQKAGSPSPVVQENPFPSLEAVSIQNHYSSPSPMVPRLFQGNRPRLFQKQQVIGFPNTGSANPGGLGSRVKNVFQKNQEEIIPKTKDALIDLPPLTPPAVSDIPQNPPVPLASLAGRTLPQDPNRSNLDYLGISHGDWHKMWGQGLSVQTKLPGQSLVEAAPSGNGPARLPDSETIAAPAKKTMPRQEFPTLTPPASEEVSSQTGQGPAVTAPPAKATLLPSPRGLPTLPPSTGQVFGQTVQGQAAFPPSSQGTLMSGPGPAVMAPPAKVTLLPSPRGLPTLPPSTTGQVFRPAVQGQAVPPSSQGTITSAPGGPATLPPPTMEGTSRQTGQGPAKMALLPSPLVPAMPPQSMIETSKQADPLMAPERFEPSKIVQAPAPLTLPQAIQEQAGPKKSLQAQQSLPPGSASVMAARNGLDTEWRALPVPLATIPNPLRPPMPPPPEVPQPPEPNAFVNAFSPPRPMQKTSDAQGMPGPYPPSPYGMMDPRLRGMMPQYAYGTLPPGRPILPIQYPTAYQGPMPPNPVLNQGPAYPPSPYLGVTQTPVFPIPVQSMPMGQPNWQANSGPPVAMVQGNNFSPEPSPLAQSQLPVDQLVSVLRDSLYPTQREWAVLQLANLDLPANPAIVEVLVTAARQDPAGTVRSSCVHGLARHGLRSQPVLALYQALGTDSDPRVRLEVDRALANLNGTSSQAVEQPVQPARHLQ